MILGWALDGQGILFRSEWALNKYLESGRLRCILPQFGLPSADLYAYYPGNQKLPARSRAFINFLIEQLAPADGGR